ncbi:hypothetical protein MUK42_28556 [Musa troglodytarum]|uniref:Alkaline phytoceramidase n=1 Tax=Musa troglodytarum TaxID=320322 RepID=A0A9E7JMV7_9LILI|nr:hypothetical protein MUK42_28556 [Musa troglodytarum]
MRWAWDQQLLLLLLRGRGRDNRGRVWAGAILLWLLLMLATPRISHSHALHLFADMRNFLGEPLPPPPPPPPLPASRVPNTLNVLTTFPFLLVGVPGLVLCLSGCCFGISLRGEMWGWAFFYAATATAAFGSAYYHLKPDDDRVVWDKLPMMASAASLLSILVIERIDERMGISCLSSLITLVLVSIACERTFDDLRLCMMFHIVPCIAIPALLFLFPPKYTHSRFWFCATGFYLLARFEAIADKKIYSASQYIISGHSLEHLCLAMVPIILTVMLWFRSIKIARHENVSSATS